MPSSFDNEYAPSRRTVPPLRARSTRPSANPIPPPPHREFYNESALQRITRKLKREPLIPLGCVLTVAALANAYRAMRRGDHNQVQRMFRARILAQGFTLVAVVAGGMYLGRERRQERDVWKVDQARKDEEKRQKWIRELEARDDEDRAVQAVMERRKKAAADRQAAAATTAAGADGGTGEAARPGNATEKGVQGSSSVMAALGTMLGGKKPEPGSEAVVSSPDASPDGEKAMPGLGKKPEEPSAARK